MMDQTVECASRDRLARVELKTITRIERAERPVSLSVWLCDFELICPVRPQAGDRLITAKECLQVEKVTPSAESYYLLKPLPSV
jgi:hypothetical protein